MVSATTIAAVASSHPSLTPPQELVYLGGPTTGPGYDYHSIVSRRAFSEHVELRTPAPFPEFSLGRFGRVPGRGTFAPFLHVIGATSNGLIGGLYPSLGSGYLMPFDLLRIDVARGLRAVRSRRRLGRWRRSREAVRQRNFGERARSIWARRSSDERLRFDRRCAPERVGISNLRLARLSRRRRCRGAVYGRE